MSWRVNFNPIAADLETDLLDPEHPFESPVKNPIMPGGLFAIDRKWFWESGAYVHPASLCGLGLPFYSPAPVSQRERPLRTPSPTNTMSASQRLSHSPICGANRLSIVQVLISSILCVLGCHRYDPELLYYGAEHVEMSVRLWMCGGTMESIPCSNVGHIYREFNRFDDAFDPLIKKVHIGRVLNRNDARVAEVRCQHESLSICGICRRI
jgi:hypothetical protein